MDANQNERTRAAAAQDSVKEQIEAEVAKLKIKYANVEADHVIRDMVQQNMFQEKQRRSLRAEQQRVRRLENRLDKATESIKDLKAEVQETKQLLC